MQITDIIISAKEVMLLPALVCLTASNITQNVTKLILIKLSGKVRNDTSINCLDFGSNQDINQYQIQK